MVSKLAAERTLHELAATIETKRTVRKRNIQNFSRKASKMGRSGMLFEAEKLVFESIILFSSQTTTKEHGKCLSRLDRVRQEQRPA